MPSGLLGVGMQGERDSRAGHRFNCHLHLLNYEMRNPGPLEQAPNSLILVRNDDSMLRHSCRKTEVQSDVSVAEWGIPFKGSERRIKAIEHLTG